VHRRFATSQAPLILPVILHVLLPGVFLDNDRHQAWTWSRRTLLQTSLAGLAMWGSRPLFGSSAFASGLPEGRLTLFNVWTDERLEAHYRNEAGQYDLEALDDINRIFRCHYTGQVAAMDVRVLEYVNMVQHTLGGGREIHIISGFRSPEYNALLVRSGRRAARNSLHMQGQAVDLRIPGVHPNVVRQAAVTLRRGGVGYYPRSKFVHLDSGPFRTW
jgi:uncharacterized protein YcbK (DUF882 family)